MKKNLIIIIIIAIFILNTGCVQDEMVNTNNSIKDTGVNNSNINTSEDNRLINKLKESTFGNHKTSTGSLFSMFTTKVEWNVEKQNNSSFVVVRVYEENNTDIDLTFAFGVNGYTNNEYFSLEAIITSEGEMTHTERENFFENMYVVHGLNKIGQIIEKTTYDDVEGEITEIPSTATERKGKPYVKFNMSGNFTDSEVELYYIVLDAKYRIEGIKDRYTFSDVIDEVLIDPYIWVEEGENLLVTISGFIERDNGKSFIELTYVIVGNFQDYDPILRRVVIDGEIINNSSIISEMYLKYDYIITHPFSEKIELTDIDIQLLDKYMKEISYGLGTTSISFIDVIKKAWSDAQIYASYDEYGGIVYVAEGYSEYDNNKIPLKVILYPTDSGDEYPYKSIIAYAYFDFDYNEVVFNYDNSRNLISAAFDKYYLSLND